MKSSNTFITLVSLGGSGEGGGGERYRAGGDSNSSKVGINNICNDHTIMVKVWTLLVMLRLRSGTLQLTLLDPNHFRIAYFNNIIDTINLKQFLALNR